MNCSHCGKELTVYRIEVMMPGAVYPYGFCDRPCLIAWLGADRPLSRRVEQAQNRAGTPQPIVVCHHNQIDPLGESQWRCVKCLKEFTEYPLAQLR